MDVVLVGLSGSGKTAVGKRLAKRHQAEFVDIDAAIEADAGRRIPDIFEAEGEAGFRDRERAAIEALGPPDRDREVKRVVSTGGGAVIEPVNRWRLFRGRLAIWLDTRPEVLAQRLRRSPNVRPLVAGSADPTATLRRLAAERGRFYGAAARVSAIAEPLSVVSMVETKVEELSSPGPAARGTRLLDAATPIGRFVIGERMAARAVAEALEGLDARRLTIVTEPVAGRLVADGLAAALLECDCEVRMVELPTGEAAKRLAAVEGAAGELAAKRAERAEPIVAVGGGALGDAAGFLAAVWLRGVPLIHVPTTLVAQIDSSIGGKTAVDISEGKNLVGAFHQPAAVVIDISFLRTLPERQRRAALGEAAKMAILGDERLLRLLESRGEAIARGDDDAFEDGSVAELIERCAWAKVEIVTADERETDAAGGRVTLNLGHSYGHALEAADGYRTLLHGEAVAYGLRGASRLGVEMGVTPAGRAGRIERLLDELGLAREPLPYPAGAVLDALGRDKKHAGGQLRWVLPTAAGVEVRSDVPEAMVERVLGGLLDGTPAAAGTGR
jgi:shikimate kinase/3-dehydroquinate synthase